MSDRHRILFGRHVGWRSEGHRGLRLGGVRRHDLRDAEVQHLQVGRAVVADGDEEVRGLEIPMHDPSRVRPRQRVRQMSRTTTSPAGKRPRLLRKTFRS